MKPTIEWYEKMLDFHTYVTGDEEMVLGEYSSVRSVVLIDNDKTVHLNINETAPAKKISQVQEFIDYYAGAGVLHMAFDTKDIVKSVRDLRSRGVQFLTIPEAYYDNLEEKLPNIKFDLAEDVKALRELNILIDYDDEGYLLQIFTQLVGDSPTIYLELIQRTNFNGFGAGNFKSLFESLERSQELRGNLTDFKKPY